MHIRIFPRDSETVVAYVDSLIFIRNTLQGSECISEIIDDLTDLNYKLLVTINHVYIMDLRREQKCLLKVCKQQQTELERLEATNGVCRV